MKIYLAQSEEDARLWQQFVETHPECASYHRWGWKHVIENSFGWRTFYLMASDQASIRGILPLAWQKSWIFGSFLTSLPFLNAGGVVAETRETEKALVQEAIGLARRLVARYLELRHRRDHGLGLPSKTTKVAPVRPVEHDVEKMWRTLQHKVRTDIRKGVKANMTASFAGVEVLDDFYGIFAENMRNLGTPVYSPRFFREILQTFPTDSYICIIQYQEEPIAASFLTGYRDTLEAVWSASRYRYSHMKPNMFLYWKLLCFAGERGYSMFDFGRSTRGSGTHRFKMQWGTEDVPLHWDYWLPEGSALPELNPENPRYRLAIWVWQKLPVAVTKLIGPPIVRCLP